MGYRRVTVKDASELLGVTEYAIRQRIRRNTLESDKDEDGRVYVLLDLDTEVSGDASDKASDVDPVHQMLREQNELLREQLAEAHAANRENRRIIAALTQRIPELESSSEAPRDARVTASDASGNGEVRPDDTEEPRSPRRSWWRSLFQ
jgi:hypothetical protein